MKKHNTAINAFIKAGDKRSPNQIDADIQLTIWKQKQVARRQKLEKEKAAKKLNKANKNRIPDPQLINEDGSPIVQSTGEAGDIVPELLLRPLHTDEDGETPSSEVHDNE